MTTLPVASRRRHWWAQILGVVIPKAIAQEFEPREEFHLLDADLPQQDFTVSLHWGRRHEHDPFLLWVRALIIKLFKQ